MYRYTGISIDFLVGTSNFVSSVLLKIVSGELFDIVVPGPLRDAILVILSTILLPAGLQVSSAVF